MDADSTLGDLFQTLMEEEVGACSLFLRKASGIVTPGQVQSMPMPMQLDQMPVAADHLTAPPHHLT